MSLRSRPKNIEPSRRDLNRKWRARSRLDRDSRKSAAPNFDRDSRKSAAPNFDRDSRKSVAISDLESEADSAFEYVNDYLHSANDPSLKIVAGICGESCRRDGSCTSPVLERQSRRFNRLANSARQLLRCYDCGTTARAVFLELARFYRGGDALSAAEIRRLRQFYDPQRYPGKQAVEHFVRAISKTRYGVFICSLSLGESVGHVWVLEKRGDLVRIYQSNLNGFLLIDHLEAEDYLRRPNRGIDLAAFIRDLRALVEPGRWTATKERKYLKWFHYRPSVSTESIGFCHAYLEFPEPRRGADR
ncbi:MAG: hypothetical protein ACYCOU_09575 [Sulfobacillus sp.]